MDLRRQSQQLSHLIQHRKHHRAERIKVQIQRNATVDSDGVAITGNSIALTGGNGLISCLPLAFDATLQINYQSLKYDPQPKRCWYLYRPS